MLKIVFKSLVLLIIASMAHAQKLPKIQETSIWAPANIKIDGKATEWSDKFQAYNPNNRIYYTIANDDDNLYLTLRASDGYGDEKALFGISFTLKKSAENGKNSKENMVVTYPTIHATRITEPIRYTMERYRSLKIDTTSKIKKKIDSLALVANKRMDESFKEMYVTGIKEIGESSISIYNEYGIKVAAQFDSHMQYTYELAIPLKYLSPFIKRGQKINYNIKMNGIPAKNPNSPYGAPTITGNIMDNMGVDNAYITFPTDLSGEYTLAKKP